MALSLDALDLLPPPGYDSGAPLRLALDDIDEDPQQPRQAFDPQSLAELAETIRERGARQPVLVRCHPTKPSRWMLNFGARRLRASRLAGLTHIPAFVDQTATSVDQFIENEQRQGLSPLEIALFVQQRLRAGESQADIARAIGKSRQYVVLATALIDPPDWLLAAYREGRCRGFNELHGLRKLASEHPEHVSAWVSGRPVITRERVLALRSELVEGSGRVRPGVLASVETPGTSRGQVTDPGSNRSTDQNTGRSPDPGADHGKGMSGTQTEPTPPSPSPVPRVPRPASLRLLAHMSGVDVEVNTVQAPPQAGQVLVSWLKEGSSQAVQASERVFAGWSAW